MEEVSRQHDHTDHSTLDRRARQNSCSLHEEVIQIKEAVTEEGIGNRACITTDDYQDVHQEVHLQILGTLHHLAT
jgi:hypothetical protein